MLLFKHLIVEDVCKLLPYHTNGIFLGVSCTPCAVLFSSSPVVLGLEATQLNSSVTDSEQTKGGGFLHCTINVWNPLPQDVMEIASIDDFKTGLDRFMEVRSLAISGRCASVDTCYWGKQE